MRGQFMDLKMLRFVYLYRKYVTTGARAPIQKKCERGE